MADMIEANKAFFVGDPAWHNKGIVLKDAPSVREAWWMALAA